VSPQTKKRAQLGDFATAYGLGEQKAALFLINDWVEIGIMDPFPNEMSEDQVAMSSPEKVSQDVYHEARYVKERSPNVNFIPRQELMWKLMRSCIGVKDSEYLWVYGNA
jgi:hypothetical protein